MEAGFSCPYSQGGERSCSSFGIPSHLSAFYLGQGSLFGSSGSISSSVRVISCRRNGKIGAARGLVSASVVSRVVAVNSSYFKGPDAAIASVHSSAAEIFEKPCAVGTTRLLEFHRQVQTSSDSKFGQAIRRWNKALGERTEIVQPLVSTRPLLLYSW
ncbi:hypothetical protein AVEN_106930-1 [Araneus ventricosus]|uniref:Uncharacterized protein n=1 Tax=Araneus ventricosus TaxID=182803 RepID=A0A4Y2JUC1_ARAVE|nr:hypothetical protein AVEN_106930-1 [Araneus ventricosus]